MNEVGLQREILWQQSRNCDMRHLAYMTDSKLLPLCIVHCHSTITVILLVLCFYCTEPAKKNKPGCHFMINGFIYD